MIVHRAFRALLRLAFHLFYNSFAFTYDPVSAIISRGHWREWTRAVIPHLVGTRVLEIPCGTGDLLLDLAKAGHRSIGVDLSSAMLRISRGKIRGVNMDVRLAQSRVQALPFPSQSFDSIVMTFPPGFVYDPNALAELYRVLDSRGRLIWVDAGRLLPHDPWSRALNAALDATSGEGNFERAAMSVLARAGFDGKVETVRDDASVVSVVIATKRSGE